MEFSAKQQLCKFLKLFSLCACLFIHCVCVCVCVRAHMHVHADILWTVSDDDAVV